MTAQSIFWMGFWIGLAVVPTLIAGALLVFVLGWRRDK